MHERGGTSGAITWMAKNPVAANLLMVVLLIGGLLMAGRVKQEVFPETDLDMVSISVPYPGASPAEVEQGIILAVEEAIRGIDGVKRVVATAAEGRASVNAELTIDADQEKALADIKSAVDRITSMPKDAERPVVSLLTNRSEVISMVVHGQQDARVLRRVAEQVRDQYLTDPRITQVDLAGAPPKEISIEVPREQLRIHSLTLEQIAQRVSATSLQLPGGGVKTATGEVLVRTDERRSDQEGFAAVPVVTGPAGTEILLGDIASVREKFAETDESASFAGEPAVMIRVYRIGSQKPLEVAAAVREQTEKAGAWLPEGVKVAQWRDMSEIYAQRMDLLWRNAQMGLILVVLCLSLFLEVRVAFWVAWGIPTSFLGALFLMPFFGASVNMISLFAFIVVLGMVVDDAIVVGENIFERAQRGETYLQAAIGGTREVGIPVVFSVLTTVAAFTPLFFVPGFMGKFMSVIPVIVISVLMISLVESLFILPAHLGHLRKPRGGVYGSIFRFQQRFVTGLDRFVNAFYAPLARAALRMRYVTLAVGVSLLLLTLTYVSAGLIGFRFMPGIEGDVVTASVELPYGSAVDQTRRVQERMLGAARELIAENGGDQVVRGLFAQIGSRGPMMGPGGPMQTGGAGHLANVQVYFVPSDQRDFNTADFAVKWRERLGPLPEAKTTSFSANMGPSAGKPVDVELSHADEDVLELASAEVVAALSEYSGVYDVSNGIAEGKPQLDLTLTQEARTLGLSATDIARQVRGAFFGAEALRQQDGRDEVRVIARLPQEERRSEHDIEELLIRTPQGGEIPLNEAAEISRGRSWPSIERADGRRIVHITAELREGDATPGMILGKLRADVLDKLPEKYTGLTWGLGGENREQRESLGSLQTGAIMALLAIYTLLAIPFRSYVQPLIVMAAIPFGIVGAIFGHIMLGFELSMMSMMGMVALSGVVVNDSLVLIDATNEFYKRGATHYDAVVAAGVRRFRPILLTSVTTFFGLIPMILEPSVQARFLIPMAISLGFGVMFATGITLILVPALYLAVEDLRGLSQTWWSLVTGKRRRIDERTAGDSLESIHIDV